MNKISNLKNSTQIQSQKTQKNKTPSSQKADAHFNTTEEKIKSIEKKLISAENSKNDTFSFDLCVSLILDDLKNILASRSTKEILIISSEIMFKIHHIEYNFKTDSEKLKIRSLYLKVLNSIFEHMEKIPHEELIDLNQSPTHELSSLHGEKKQTSAENDLFQLSKKDAESTADKIRFLLALFFLEKSTKSQKINFESISDLDRNLIKTSLLNIFKNYPQIPYSLFFTKTDFIYLFFNEILSKLEINATNIDSFINFINALHSYLKRSAEKAWKDANPSEGQTIIELQDTIEKYYDTLIKNKLKTKNITFEKGYLEVFIKKIDVYLEKFSPGSFKLLYEKTFPDQQKIIIAKHIKSIFYTKISEPMVTQYAYKKFKDEKTFSGDNTQKIITKTNEESGNELANYDFYFTELTCLFLTDISTTIGDKIHLIELGICITHRINEKIQNSLTSKTLPEGTILLSSGIKTLIYAYNITNDEDLETPHLYMKILSTVNLVVKHFIAMIYFFKHHKNTIFAEKDFRRMQQELPFINYYFNQNGGSESYLEEIQSTIQFTKKPEKLLALHTKLTNQEDSEKTHLVLEEKFISKILNSQDYKTLTRKEFLSLNTKLKSIEEQKKNASLPQQNETQTISTNTTPQVPHHTGRKEQEDIPAIDAPSTSIPLAVDTPPVAPPLLTETQQTHTPSLPVENDAGYSTEEEEEYDASKDPTHYSHFTKEKQTISTPILQQELTSLPSKQIKYITFINPYLQNKIQDTPLFREMIVSYLNDDFNHHNKFLKSLDKRITINNTKKLLLEMRILPKNRIYYVRDGEKLIILGMSENAKDQQRVIEHIAKTTYEIKFDDLKE